jgi:hypothetical protein
MILNNAPSVFVAQRATAKHCKIAIARKKISRSAAGPSRKIREVSHFALKD